MPDAPTQSIELSPPAPHVPGAVVWVGLALFLLVGLFVAIFDGHTSAEMFRRGAIFFTALAGFVGGIRLRSRRMQRRLRLGADGIHIGRAWGDEHFVPWDEVVGLTRSVSHRLHLKTKGGELLLGTDIDRGHDPLGPPVKERPTWAPDLKAGAHLADVIAAAKSHYERSASRCGPALEGVEPSEWRRVLNEAMNSGDYRGRGLTRADLVADLANPSVDPELRALIARMLKPRLDEVERLQEILSATAAPRARVALEAAVEEVRVLRDKSQERVS